MCDISWAGGINSLGAEITCKGISNFLTRSVRKGSITNAKPALQKRDQGLVCTHFTFLIPLSSFFLSDMKGMALLCLFSYMEQQLGTSQLWCCGNADSTAGWKAPAGRDDAEVLHTT